MQNASEKPIETEFNDVTLNITEGIDSSSEEMYSTFLATFLNSFDEAVERIGKAIDAKEPKEFKEAAHSLKGSSSYIYAKKFSSMCLAMQQCAEREKFDLGKEIYEKCKIEKMELIKKINSYLNNPKPVDPPKEIDSFASRVENYSPNPKKSALDNVQSIPEANEESSQDEKNEPEKQKSIKPEIHIHPPDENSDEKKVIEPKIPKEEPISEPTKKVSDANVAEIKQKDSPKKKAPSKKKRIINLNKKETKDEIKPPKPKEESSSDESEDENDYPFDNIRKCIIY